MKKKKKVHLKIDIVFSKIVTLALGRLKYLVNPKKQYIPAILKMIWKFNNNYTVAAIESVLAIIKTQ